MAVTWKKLAYLDDVINNSLIDATGDLIYGSAEYTAAMTDMLDFTEWITNAFKNKSRQMIDYVVEQSGRGSRHTSVAAKERIINDLIGENSDLIKPAKDRNVEVV